MSWRQICIALNFVNSHTFFYGSTKFRVCFKNFPYPYFKYTSICFSTTWIPVSKQVYNRSCVFQPTLLQWEAILLHLPTSPRGRHTWPSSRLSRASGSSSALGFRPPWPRSSAATYPVDQQYHSICSQWQGKFLTQKLKLRVKLQQFNKCWSKTGAGNYFRLRATFKSNMLIQSH